MRSDKLLKQIVDNTKPVPLSVPTKRLNRIYGQGAEGATTTIAVSPRERWRVLAVTATYLATNAGNFQVIYNFEGNVALLVTISSDITAGRVNYISFYPGADTNLNNMPGGITTDVIRCPLPDIILEGDDTITLNHQEAGAPGAAPFYYVILYERSEAE